MLFGTISCAGHLSVNQKCPKNAFFCTSKKDAYQMLELYKINLVKIDSTGTGRTKTYIIYYKE